MLIIARRVQEDFSITIAPEDLQRLASGDVVVRVKLLGIGKHVARIGIEAPRAVKVMRGELEETGI